MPSDSQSIPQLSDDLSHDQIVELLSTDEQDAIKALFTKAYQVKVQQVGTQVYFRGIIEFSNQCTKDCYYCGIRRSNRQVKRFAMDEDEIIQAGIWAHEQQYGSIVLQSGERQDPAFVDFVERIVSTLKQRSQGQLGITLSLGEQSEETYARWFRAGAHRYLLRIETSNEQLYRRLHPDDHDPYRRLECLTSLRAQGYQVGTGVMIGLPGQCAEDLARDIAFFKKHDIDMIGMGPYVVHAQTPIAATVTEYDPAHQLELGLRMIALTRIALQDVNIAATTALQALDPQGREKGLQAGANIIMPNITDTQYRASYQLYDGKPCLDENASLCQGCLDRRISGIGETVGLGQWGDSPHFMKRRSGGAHE